MSKKRRKERLPAVDRQLHQEASPEPGEPHEVEASYRGNYILVQWFTIKAGERQIEKWFADFSEESRERLQGEIARVRRMFRALVGNERALDLVCRYLVLAEQDAMGDHTYVVEHYEKEKLFIEVLRDVADCFAPEDKQWLLSLLKQDRDPELDLVIAVDGLREAFKLTPSGFHTQEDTIFPPGNASQVLEREDE